MGEVRRVREIEIDDDLAFQKRLWKVQSYGQMAIGILIVLSALGLFGGKGPLARAEKTDQNGALRLEYDRFIHYDAPVVLRLNLIPGSANEVWFDRNYLSHFKLEQVEPDPKRVEVGTDRITFVFNRNDIDKPSQVSFHLEAEKIGTYRGKVAVGNQTPLEFKQFAFP